MNLSDGVQHNPGQLEYLIAITSKAGEALITIDPALGYTLNDRDFRESFQDLFSDDYRSFGQLYHLVDQSPVYSGAEHRGDPKLPNITVLPNIFTSQEPIIRIKSANADLSIPAGQEVTLFGCTIGHWHGQKNCFAGIQEIYEFQSYGALLIDYPECAEVELWIARDGDKVVVPQQCHMTLYNLDDRGHPLITLDFANPTRNHANKELVKQTGPILLTYYTAHEAIFLLNRHYINRERVFHADPAPTGVENEQCLNGGVHLAASAVVCEVRIPLGTRASLGEQIYDALTEDPTVINQFNKLGIRVRKASPEVQLDGIWYSRPLTECVKLGAGNPLYRAFLLSGAPEDSEADSEEIPEPKGKMHVVEGRWCELGPRFLEPGRRADEQAQRDIQILIEGAGTWVENAFIPSIAAARAELARRRQQGQKDLRDLKVVIADDSRWHTPEGTPPVIPNSQHYPKLAAAIESGKVAFLDKAAPADLHFYHGLNPGVVFIITPDYTHSRLCQSYLDRVPTIFVEKPFDANWKNVRALLEARGRAKLDTQIYALDHYRFYAWRLKEPVPSGKTLLEEATSWLGGALRTVRFFMTEGKPVEPNRMRTLQYGLLLDMLPHCFGMLTFFGRIDSLDEFEIVDVGRYRGAPIPNETFAHVHFTFEDYSNNGCRVPCEAWVGKGLEKGRKYFEVMGRNGNSVLITFGDTNWRGSTQGNRKIAGGIYFVSKGQLTKKAELAPSGSRYAQLFVDMVTGERKAIISAMPLIAGERIVHALDRFWTAIQTQSTWCSYEIGDLDCF